MYFFDYGNAFLLEASRAGADILREDGTFVYPSYVQDIMGPLFFDYGFGPYRWVCTSSNADDLAVTDQIAASVLEEIATSAPEEIKNQLLDNIHWIKEAGANKLVVGSQARILYADSEGRIKIALEMNRAIRRAGICSNCTWQGSSRCLRNRLSLQRDIKYIRWLILYSRYGNSECNRRLFPRRYLGINPQRRRSRLGRGY
jgi:Urocanate hydratase